jgi:hypothetical protein
LEEQIETTNLEWQEKVCKLEAQMFTDGCKLMELKWKTAKLRWLENKARLNQKRAYCKNRARQQHDGQPTLPHQYPTRAATVAANEKMGEAKREIERMGERIAEVED